MDESGAGTIAYRTDAIAVDPSAPGFTNGKTRIGDEELVRAFLLVQLTSELGYAADGRRVLLERVYKAVGRPGKGGRIDVLVRGSENDPEADDAFLFIECKAPSKFDEDLKLIDGQLFRLSRQEPVRPRYLVYYTVEFKSDKFRDRLILIDTSTFDDFESWDLAGQPITDALPKSYGIAQKRLYGNVAHETSSLEAPGRRSDP